MSRELMQAIKHEHSPVQSWEKRFSVPEYYRMAEAGVLGENERVELVEGVIVEMAAMGSRHAACVRRLEALLSQHSPRERIISTQCPVRLDDNSEPEPDLALLKPREDFYSSEHPGPDDVLLVIEVSDTSAEYDTEVKLPLYARAGIPETWLVNLATETIEAHSRPASGGYRQTLRAKRGESLKSETVSGLELSAEDVLG
ncbi:MAG: Uma2 family endonuclease [Rubrobacteraceae bacterium]